MTHSIERTSVVHDRGGIEGDVGARHGEVDGRVDGPRDGKMVHEGRCAEGMHRRQQLSLGP